ncbi:hypothetical protein ACHAW6_008256 [Cyclotella cf. meneghiniana]
MHVVQMTCFEYMLYRGPCRAKDLFEKVSPSSLQDVSLNKKASPSSVTFPKLIMTWDCNMPIASQTCWRMSQMVMRLWPQKRIILWKIAPNLADRAVHGSQAVSDCGSILEEVKELIDRGYKEDAYGRDMIVKH